VVDLGDLGFDDTKATGINSLGAVVGFGQTDVSNKHAFVWFADDGMSDLNQRLDESGAGWTLTEAYGINDGGQIVGLGYHDPPQPDGSTPVSAFLLTPVPEPQLLSLLVAVLAASARIGRPKQSVGTSVC
jgi:probable HAF family extracellular repeat protein